MIESPKKSLECGNLSRFQKARLVAPTKALTSQRTPKFPHLAALPPLLYSAKLNGHSFLDQLDQSE